MDEDVLENEKGDSDSEGDNMYLKIQVKDTGEGIRPKDQDKLFKLFGYLKATQNKNVNGIGLGLVISKQIVEQFGGKIYLKSTF